MRMLAAGSITDALAAAATIVLAILGLAGSLPGYTAAIATIALGVALFVQGGSISMRYSQLVRPMAGEVSGSETHAAGAPAETIAGVAGIVLGILALVGLYPLTLLPIAVIVFGAGLLIGREATARVDRALTFAEHERTAAVVHEAAVAASGAQVLVGIGAAVLGILALIGMAPLTLTLVALLCLGGAALLSGTALGAEIMRAMPR